MTDTVIAISKAEIETLEKLYELKDTAEVVKFINQYPFLLPVLLEAPEKIKQYFPDGPLSLEVDYDPEISGLVQLLLSVPTDLEAKEAINRHNQLDYSWWLYLSYEVRANLCVLLV